MKILSSFTHPQVVPKPVLIICSAEHKGRYMKKVCNQAVLGTTDFNSREKKYYSQVNGAPELLCFPHSSEYLSLCSAEQIYSYNFGATWVNDDRIFIFWVNYPFKELSKPLKTDQRLKY